MRYPELQDGYWRSKFDDVPATALSFAEQQGTLLMDIANQLRRLNAKFPKFAESKKEE